MTVKNKKNKQPNIIEGIISITSTGAGYVRSEDLEEDVRIESHLLNTALNGDVVDIVMLPKEKDAKSIPGEVVEVKEREKIRFVGSIDKRKGKSIAFFIPDSNKVYTDFFLPPQEAKKVKNNQKVLVELVEWDDAKKNPEAKIVTVIGEKGEHNAEMSSIIYDHGLEKDFNKDIAQAAKEIQKKSKPIDEREISRRRDMRDLTTFTIDPDDAKDFDDAISIKELDGGKIELGVHIADVSHYVKEDSALDKEARKRGYSIYLVDRTIPMLPEELSNDICSLNPNEDKLAFSVVLNMGKDGNIEKSWMGRTVIHSDVRFTYEEAQDIVDSKKGKCAKELLILEELTRKLQKKRVERGALEFDSTEVEFELDNTGKPVRIYEKEDLYAHKMIEEAMILANRAVAEYFMRNLKKKKYKTGIYRVHDAPKQEETDELLVFLKTLGHTVETKEGKISTKSLNDLFKKVHGEPEEHLIKMASIKSMVKAQYSTENIGHFGLAIKNYTHFTSPIRRYADLLAHRILHKQLTGESISNKEHKLYELICGDLNQKEMQVNDAERSSISHKQVEYMIERIGEVYEGVISGVTNWGVYVEEIETKAEGLVHIRNMDDDYYTMEEDQYALVGKNKKKRYALGDKVKIKVVAGDLEQKTLDYKFV